MIGWPFEIPGLRETHPELMSLEKFMNAHRHYAVPFLCKSVIPELPPDTART